MIKQNKSTSWATSLINAITDPEELFQLLELDPAWLAGAKSAATLYPLKIPRNMLAHIEKGNIDDPILRQFLPIDREFDIRPDFTHDPLKEKTTNPVPGLLHKYHGRVLLTLTSACGVNCRFCFRRHFPYAENNPNKRNWQPILEYIKKDPSIQEVILSGGDPLVLNDHTLAEFTKKLSDIPQLKRLRIHSRMPIVMPERINDSFVQWLTTLPFKTILIVHANHPREIQKPVQSALQQLVGVTLLNQSVLLKGVNDDIETLISLSEILFDAGVLPYYLNLLDKVQGAAHYEVEPAKAIQLHQQLLARLPGYLVPKLVYEQAGEKSKRPVF